MTTSSYANITKKKKGNSEKRLTLKLKPMLLQRREFLHKGKNLSCAGFQYLNVSVKPIHLKQLASALTPTTKRNKNESPIYLFCKPK